MLSPIIRIELTPFMELDSDAGQMVINEETYRLCPEDVIYFKDLVVIPFDTKYVFSLDDASNYNSSNVTVHALDIHIPQCRSGYITESGTHKVQEDWCSTLYGDNVVYCACNMTYFPLSIDHYAFMVVNTTWNPVIKVLRDLNLQILIDFLLGSPMDPTSTNQNHSQLVSHGSHEGDAIELWDIEVVSTGAYILIMCGGIVLVLLMIGAIFWKCETNKDRPLLLFVDQPSSKLKDLKHGEVQFLVDSATFREGHILHLRGVVHNNMDECCFTLGLTKWHHLFCLHLRQNGWISWITCLKWRYPGSHLFNAQRIALVIMYLITLMAVICLELEYNSYLIPTNTIATFGGKYSDMVWMCTVVSIMAYIPILGVQWLFIHSECCLDRPPILDEYQDPNKVDDDNTLNPNPSSPGTLIPLKTGDLTLQSKTSGDSLVSLSDFMVKASKMTEIIRSRASKSSTLSKSKENVQSTNSTNPIPLDPNRPSNPFEMIDRDDTTDVTFTSTSVFDPSLYQQAYSRRPYGNRTAAGNNGQHNGQHTPSTTRRPSDSSPNAPPPSLASVPEAFHRRTASQRSRKHTPSFSSFSPSKTSLLYGQGHGAKQRYPNYFNDSYQFGYPDPYNYQQGTPRQYQGHPVVGSMVESSASVTVLPSSSAKAPGNLNANLSGNVPLNVAGNPGVPPLPPRVPSRVPPTPKVSKRKKKKKDRDKMDKAQNLQTGLVAVNLWDMLCEFVLSLLIMFYCGFLNRFYSLNHIDFHFSVTDRDVSELFGDIKSQKRWSQRHVPDILLLQLLSVLRSKYWRYTIAPNQISPGDAALNLLRRRTFDELKEYLSSCSELERRMILKENKERQSINAVITEEDPLDALSENASLPNRARPYPQLNAPRPMLFNEEDRKDRRDRKNRKDGKVQKVGKVGNQSNYGISRKRLGAPRGLHIRRVSASRLSTSKSRSQRGYNQITHIDSDDDHEDHPDDPVPMTRRKPVKQRTFQRVQQHEDLSESENSAELSERTSTLNPVTPNVFYPKMPNESDEHSSSSSSVIHPLQIAQQMDGLHELEDTADTDHRFSLPTSKPPPLGMRPTLSQRQLSQRPLPATPKSDASSTTRKKTRKFKRRKARSVSVPDDEDFEGLFIRYNPKSEYFVPSFCVVITWMFVVAVYVMGLMIFGMVYGRVYGQNDETNDVVMDLSLKEISRVSDKEYSLFRSVSSRMNHREFDLMEYEDLNMSMDDLFFVISQQEYNGNDDDERSQCVMDMDLQQQIKNEVYEMIRERMKVMEYRLSDHPEFEAFYNVLIHGNGTAVGEEVDVSEQNRQSFGALMVLWICSALSFILLIQPMLLSLYSCLMLICYQEQCVRAQLCCCPVLCWSISCSIRSEMRYQYNRYLIRVYEQQQKQHRGGTKKGKEVQKEGQQVEGRLVLKAESKDSSSGAEPRKRRNGTVALTNGQLTVFAKLARLESEKNAL